MVGQDPLQKRFANVVCGTDVAREPTKTLPDIETVDAVLNFFRRWKHNFTRSQGIWLWKHVLLINTESLHELKKSNKYFLNQY